MALHAIKLGVVILGAGASTRMGRPKLLLPWEDSTVIGHEVAVWRRVGAEQVAVVVSLANEALETELDRIGVSGCDRIVNPHPERGMFSSIQCAALWDGWRSAPGHWAVALGDQPHLRRSMIEQLIACVANRPELIWQPKHAGRVGHPVIFPGELFRRIGSSSDATLKEFLSANSRICASCELDEPALSLDIDTPADYERARRLYSGVPDAGDTVR